MAVIILRSAKARRLEPQASKPEGFSESEIRTIGENSRVLKFDLDSGFEKS